MIPLYNQLNAAAQQPQLAQMLQRFNEFKNAYSGNPRQAVQALLNSGQLSQQQYNQFAATARQLQQFIK